MFQQGYDKILFFIFLILLLPNCGGGIGTAPPSSPFLQEGVTALNLGGNFPADIDIVDQDGLRNIAFITLTEPAAVIAIDLDKTPLAHSDIFQGLSQDKLNGLGFPNNLFIVDATHAFLLTSNAESDSLVYFNPKEGSVYDSVSLATPLNLSGNPLKKINGKGMLDPQGETSNSFVFMRGNSFQDEMFCAIGRQETLLAL